MIKRFLTFALAALVLLAAGCGGDASEVQKTNIVVVLDVSDSMNVTDPAGGGTYFASTLLMAFNANSGLPFQTSDDKILDNTYFGLVTYGLNAKDNVPLRSLGNMSDEEYSELYKEINSIEYDAKDGTNYYEGMKKAYEMCEENGADRNLIYILSDGEFSLGMGKDREYVASEESRKIEDYKSTVLSDSKYTVSAIAINTDTENVGDVMFESFGNLASPTYRFKSVKQKSEFDSVAIEYLKELKTFLNLDMDFVDITSKVDDGIVTVELDKDYKTVQLWMLPADVDNKKANRKEANPPELISVTAPGDKEARPFENGMKVGGFLGLRKSTVSVSEESGVALKAFIENAKKGTWTFEVSEKMLIVKQAQFNPFPWGPVITIAVVGIILLVLLLMWLFYIPPIRYRKKAIPGFLTMERTDGYGNSFTVYENTPVYAIIRKGKFINKGNLTMGTLLNDKNFKNVIVKYRPDNSLSDARLEIRGKELSGQPHNMELYSDITNNYSLNENAGIVITWSC